MTEEPATPTPPPRASGPVKPRIWPALLVGAAILPLGWLTAVVLGLLFVGYRVAFGEAPPGTLLDLESPESFLFVQWLGSTSLIVLLVWLARRSRVNPWDRFALGPSRLSIWLQPVIVLGAFAAGIVGTHLSTLLLVGPSESVAEAGGLVRLAGRDWLPGAVLVMAVLPALTEELLFRGYVQSRLLLRLPAGSAILLSSVLFAVAHGEPAHAIAVLPSGIWLGYVAYLSGSVWPGMICHFLGNALWVLVSMFGSDQTQEGAAEVQAAAEAQVNVGEILADIVPLLLLLAVLSWILRKRRRRQDLVIAVHPFGGR